MFFRFNYTVFIVVYEMNSALPTQKYLCLNLRIYPLVSMKTTILPLEAVSVKLLYLSLCLSWHEHTEIFFYLTYALNFRLINIENTISRSDFASKRLDESISKANGELLYTKCAMKNKSFCIYINYFCLVKEFVDELEMDTNGKIFLCL